MVSKWQRIFKDIKQKNEHNQKMVDIYNEKYAQFNKRNKAGKQDKKERSSTLSFNEHRIAQEIGQPEMNISSYFDIAIDQNSQNWVQQNKKPSIFKIPSISARKRSNTLKPLGEKRENKDIFPQKII